MKTICFTLCLLILTSANAQVKKDTALRAILLEQLKTTHDQQDWFVPVIKSLEGLTPEQATWKPSDSSHSVAQLAAHLLFWNKEQLNKYNEIKQPAFDGNNDNTFANLSADKWQATIKELDDVMKQWEQIVQTADEAKLVKWYSVIAHIGTHNAYHTGQILYLRKLQGSWNPANGVK